MDLSAEMLDQCRRLNPDVELHQIEHDRHQTGLFPRTTWTQRLTQAGFTPKTHQQTLKTWPHPYELLVCKRR